MAQLFTTGNTLLITPQKGITFILLQVLYITSSENPSSLGLGNEYQSQLSNVSSVYIKGN